MIIFKPAAASACRHARILLGGVVIRGADNRTVAPALRSICWYSETPTPSQGTVSYLRNWKNGAHLYLVGTAHVSAESAEEVRQVINQVKPDAIAVELCKARAKGLQSEKRAPKSFIELLKTVFGTTGGPGQKLLGLVIQSFYEHLRTLGLEPGKEFQVAIQEAERLGIKLHCIDQDVNFLQVTMKRLWDALSFWDLFRLYTRAPKPWAHEAMAASRTGNPGEWVERIKTREVVRSMFRDMEAIAPNVVRVLVHERDEVMAKQLRQYEGTIVGVVGMAHMDGIERRWREADQ